MSSSMMSPHSAGPPPSCPGSPGCPPIPPIPGPGSKIPSREPPSPPEPPLISGSAVTTGANRPAKASVNTREKSLLLGMLYFVIERAQVSKAGPACKLLLLRKRSRAKSPPCRHAQDPFDDPCHQTRIAFCTPFHGLRSFVCKMHANSFRGTGIPWEPMKQEMLLLKPLERATVVPGWNLH